MPAATLRPIVFALGTRGDVEPVLAVALKFSPSVLIVTHLCHRIWVAPWLAPRPVAVEFVSSPPSSTWTWDSKSRSAHDSLLEAELVTIARRRLGKAEPWNCVVTNLFALEAAHIAEAYSLPLCVLSPYKMPHDTPPLDALAQQVPPWMAPTRVPTHQHVAGTLVLGDVQSWLFPLYICAERWANVRRLLRLADPAPWWRGPAPAPLLLYGLPRSLVGPAGLELDSHLCCGFWRLPAAPASDKASDLLVPIRPAGRERCPVPPILVTFGSLIPLGVITAHAELGALLQALLLVARRTGHPVLFVMHPAAGLQLDYARASIPLVEWPLEKSLLGGRLFSDDSRETDFSGSHWLTLYCGEDVPFADLLPLCAAAVHHGGSGTAAACWLAGTPQIIAPLMFDQPCWARAVSSTGTGVALESLDSLLDALTAPTDDAGCSAVSAKVEDVASAITRALSSPIASSCTQLQKHFLSEPEGTSVAFDTMQSFFSSWRPSTASLTRRVAVDLRSDDSSRPFTSLHLEVFESDIEPCADDCDERTSTYEAHITVEVQGGMEKEALPICVVVDCGGPEEIGLISHEVFGSDVYFCKPSADAVCDDSAAVAVVPVLPWPRDVLSRLCRRHCPLRYRVVDVGANVGLFGLRCWMDVAAFFYGSSAAHDTRQVDLELLAVEPVQRTAHMLASNLTRAGCSVRRWPFPDSSAPPSSDSALPESTGSFPSPYTSIRWSCVVARTALSDPVTVAAAREACTVSGASSTVAMRVWPRILGNATMHPLEKLQQKQSLHSPEHAARLFKDGFTEMVPVMTLSETLASAGASAFRTTDGCDIDLLKIDVEGSELRVLRGLHVNDWRRIRAVSMEVHDVGTRLRDVLELLTAPLLTDAATVGGADDAAPSGTGSVTRSCGLEPVHEQFPKDEPRQTIEARCGGGFMADCVCAHRAAHLPAGANNFHVFAWRP